MPTAKRGIINSCVFTWLCSVACFPVLLRWPAATPPKTWIDPDTGHRVVRLTDEPGSASLYFNQNGYTADGKKMIYTTPEGISALDLATHATKPRREGPRPRHRHRPQNAERLLHAEATPIFCHRRRYAGATREIAKFPPRGSVAPSMPTKRCSPALTSKAMAPDYQRHRPPGRAAARPRYRPRNKGQMMEQRLAAHLPMAHVHHQRENRRSQDHPSSTDWLNHLEFSPTDPTLLMFCHEGPWHKVDRIWTIRTDGTHITQIHTRTMAMEIFGHEFWAPDGKTIWYDLQTPRGEDFWLAGYNVETGAAHLVSSAAQRVVDPLQRDARRQAVLRRWRRSRPGGPREKRRMDLSVPSRSSSRIAALKTRTSSSPACFAPRAWSTCRSTIQAGAERQFHARSEVGGLPLQHVRRHLCVRGGGSESPMNMKLLLLSYLSPYRPTRSQKFDLPRGQAEPLHR